MQNLWLLWNGLDNRKRLIVLGAVFGVFFAVLGLSRMATTPNMALLYAGLEASSAGEVVAALEKSGVVYEVRGDSIYVDTASRDALRMALAAEGLPTNGASGYELLDQLSGFGTTSQMFDAAYWRAKEGELARTILAMPQVRAARVHIAQAPNSPFQRDVKPTASVTLTTGAGISPAQARALRHLVSTAVPNMDALDVAIIDSVAGLIDAADEQQLPSAAALAKAAEIKGNVERLLAARVGPNAAIVEVAVEVVTESERITEKVFDPQSRVAISSETEQRSESSAGAAGDVTVASNLPDGDAAASGGPKSENSENRERLNFEVSETQRDVQKVPGDIKRISLAVLVDGQDVTAPDGTISREPRSEEELATLAELVGAAAGLQTERGDIITLKSLIFLPSPEIDPLEPVSVFPSFAQTDFMALIQTGVLAVVALILGLFVLRPILTGNSNRIGLQNQNSNLSLAAPAGSTPIPADRVLTGEIDDGIGPSNLALIVNAEDRPEVGTSDPVGRLRRLIESRQAESVEILRGWMESEEGQR